MFNVKDLSAVRFISRVFLEHYPDLARSDFLPEDPEAIDLIVLVLLNLVGASFAPTAMNEIRLLDGRGSATAGEDAGAVSVEKRQEQTIGRVADFIGGQDLGIDTNAERDVRRMIMDAGSSGRADFKLESASDRKAVARVAVTGVEDIYPSSAGRAGGSGRSLKGFFYFASQLRRFRHCLTDELTMLHRKAGLDPRLVSPAMVDFGRWLRDDPSEGSTFTQQVAVWSRISRRKSGPPVHGYVGFCPLRQIQYDLGLLGPGHRIDTPCNDDPLGVVRSALAEHGFIGVKLYPPMGFRAAHNSNRGSDASYPREILLDTFGEVTPATVKQLGLRLDDALARLYALCHSLDAPIIAHGANSNAAFEGSGQHADPYYWQPVFARFDVPAVMLAHYGGFQYRSADPLNKRPGAAAAGTAVPLDQTYEMSLARYLHENRGSRVFADISMFTELFDTELRALALSNFRTLDEIYPHFKQRLVFGTDWHMLATEPRAGEYDGLIKDFIRDAFGSAYVEPIMRGNFIEFSGMGPGGATRRRIEAFYGNDTALLARLSLLDRS